MIIRYHLLCEGDGGLVVGLGNEGSRVRIHPGPSDFSEQKICPTYSPLHPGV